MTYYQRLYSISCFSFMLLWHKFGAIFTKLSSNHRDIEPCFQKLSVNIQKQRSKLNLNMAQIKTRGVVRTEEHSDFFCQKDHLEITYFPFKDLLPRRRGVVLWRLRETRLLAVSAEVLEAATPEAGSSSGRPWARYPRTGPAAAAWVSSAPRPVARSPWPQTHPYPYPFQSEQEVLTGETATQGKYSIFAFNILAPQLGYKDYYLITNISNIYKTARTPFGFLQCSPILWLWSTLCPFSSAYSHVKQNSFGKDCLAWVCGCLS